MLKSFVAFRIVYGALALLFVFNSLQGMLGLHSLKIAVIVDIVSLSVVAFSVARLPIENLVKIGAVLGVVLVAFSAMDLWNLRGGLESEFLPISHPRPTHPTMKPNVPKGNIYQIVLDGFQSDIYKEMLAADLGLADEPFTFFSGFRSGYWQTHLSIPSILLGEYYDGIDRIHHWAYQKFQEGGIYRDLFNSGFEVNQYVFYPYYCSALATICDFQIIAAGKDANQRAVVDLWFLSLLPSSLRILSDRAAAPNEDRPGAAPIVGFSISSALQIFNEPPLEYHPIHALRGFERFLSAEAAARASGRYTFLHLIMPHGPYVLSSSCEPIQPGADTKQAYVAQGQCGLRLVRQLIAELKRLGRYDDALIIIDADHGWQFVKGPDGQMMTEKKRSPRASRLSPIVARDRRTVGRRKRWRAPRMPCF